MKDTCPTRDLLVQFVNATLTDTEADKIVAHLDSCESCCRTVDELERTQPALAALDQLRDADDLDKIESPLPKKIGQYEIVEQIGQGGMGVVYRAVHPHLKREVALKIIRDSRLDDPTARERFVQEMQSLGRLSHPNIVHATDARIDGDTPFIVTELLDGHDLGTWIAAHGKMPIKQAIACIRQAATGLAYAHEKGYVHRDIKPSNLFLTHGGVVKILDLGIARPLETGPGNGQTVTGHIVGSPEFMAPEQFHDGTVDARSDIYSLGRTFAYILNENVPTRLKRVLIQMTTGLPDQRYQSADELIRALDAATKSPKLLFCTAAFVAIIVAAIFFMRPSAVPVPPVEPHSKTVVSPEIKTGTGTLDETDSFHVREFDISSPLGWDGFFADVLNHHFRNPPYDLNDEFTIFRLLRQMGRKSDVERLIEQNFAQRSTGDPLARLQRRIHCANIFAEWEQALEEQEKSDEYHSRIEKWIADEPSEPKRNNLRQYYETEKQRQGRSRRKVEYGIPKGYRNLVLLGEPSVKSLCDVGDFQAAVQRCSSILRNDESGIEHEDRLNYGGCGNAYIVGRMVERDELDAGKKLWQETPCAEEIYFRMGCFLALGYLKADRKNEAQAIWDDSVIRLTMGMNRANPIEVTRRISCILESISDSGLYEYVRNESGK